MVARGVVITVGTVGQTIETIVAGANNCGVACPVAGSSRSVQHVETRRGGVAVGIGGGDAEALDLNLY